MVFIFEPLLTFLYLKQVLEPLESNGAKQSKRNEGLQKKTIGHAHLSVSLLKYLQ